MQQVLREITGALRPSHVTKPVNLSVQTAQNCRVCGGKETALGVIIDFQSREAHKAGGSRTMLCDDCLALIRLADQEFQSTTSESPFVAKTEVTTSSFAASVQGKCYLCTRLLIQLGDAKWQHILSDLPEINLVAFDKSAHCHPPSLILVRLGCKLTPVTARGQDGTPVLGKSYSYGYLQVAVLPRHERWAVFILPC